MASLVSHFGPPESKAYALPITLGLRFQLTNNKGKKKSLVEVLE